MVILRVKAVKVGNSVRVAVPVEILAAASVKAGDALLIDFDTKSKTIILEKET